MIVQYVENTSYFLHRDILGVVRGESDIPAKNNECVPHRWIEHEFVVFIIYTTCIHLMLI